MNEINLVDMSVEGMSNCCGAKVYEPDICSQCKEHCEVENEDMDCLDEDTYPEERLTQEEENNNV